MKIVKYMFSIILIISPPLLFAHGTIHEIITGGAVCIKASFDTGEPMAGSKVLVFPPGETTAAYDLKTDNTGIVCLKPGRPGTWILQVRDDGGHGQRINLVVRDDMIVETAPGEQGFSFIQKIIMAIAVVTGLVGIALFIKSKRE